MYPDADQAAAFLRSAGFGRAAVGVIPGTGLGKFARSIIPVASVRYSEIPGFPESTVESHKGLLIYGSSGDKQVIALQGRFHLYEGYNFDQVTFPVLVMHKMGVRTLLVTNAAGALNPSYRKGELMRLTDHISLQSVMPSENSSGFRFRSEYDPALAELIDQTAEKSGIKLHQGIYAAVTGPMLETRAEYRMLIRMGADAVGMSTVPELMMARHLGMRYGALSVLTDECDPENLIPVTIDEIIKTANSADGKLSDLLEKVIQLC